jgi:hypothetical protein
MRNLARVKTGFRISPQHWDLTRLILFATISMIAPGLSSQSAQPAPPFPEPVQTGAAPQTTPSAQVSATTPASGFRPIAIVPLDSKIPGHAFEVTGELQVSNGRAFIAANGSIASGDQSTHVTLPYRGTLLVCAYTTVKLTADSSVPGGEVPGLMLALEHGAVEMSFAAGRAHTRNADFLLTPDFHILIGGPGAADVKVRLGPQGDTCVDNALAPGAGAPYVLVSSVFDGGAYRVQPGQRVMFQHGSLHEVVDQEKESCGCPPAEAKGNEFPLAQSEGLAPMPEPATAPPGQNPASTVPVEPLVYKSAEYAPQAAAGAETTAAQGTEAGGAGNTPKAGAQKKPGFLTRVGRFFKRIFGAE